MLDEYASLSVTASDVNYSLAEKRDSDDKTFTVPELTIALVDSTSCEVASTSCTATTSRNDETNDLSTDFDD